MNDVCQIEKKIRIDWLLELNFIKFFNRINFSEKQRFRITWHHVCNLELLIITKLSASYDFCHLETVLTMLHIYIFFHFITSYILLFLFSEDNQPCGCMLAGFISEHTQLIYITTHVCEFDILSMAVYSIQYNIITYVC